MSATNCFAWIRNARWLIAQVLTAAVLFPAVLATWSAGSAVAADRLVVHEWGTFTALQNEFGEQLGGINVDDEPVPAFVHNLNPYVLRSSYVLQVIESKGAPQRHPYVNVRLETPVIYFYPPVGQKLPLSLDVSVGLNGGWLTEFYPQAEAEAPGLKQNAFQFGAINDDTLGRLTWRHLRVGTDAAWPATNENVWLAPRKTEAWPVETTDGEAEKYLFYRGVGNFKVPLAVRHSDDGQRLIVRSNLAATLPKAESQRVNAAWYVHLRPDGKTAFRSLGAFYLDADSTKDAASTERAFAEADYQSEHINTLKQQMFEALVAEGLFADEAHALLNTWDRAYFQKHGLRVFYLVPPAWTDRRMPLTVSSPADVTRVMVGRIELVSPEQRALLTRLAKTPISSGEWVAKAMQSPEGRKLASGHSDFANLGVTIPNDYQMYLDMGRFRNALVLSEARRRPGTNLDEFIATYRLGEFVPPDGQ